MQFLVLARVAEGIAMEQASPHVEAEAKAVWQNYLAEIVRAIYYIADMRDAVLMCEAPTLETITGHHRTVSNGTSGSFNV